ncbi:MAG: hypothetical protein WA324_17630 [Bryobacteraceae bacterium]
MESTLRLAVVVGTSALMVGSAFGKTGAGIAKAQTLTIHLGNYAEARGEALHPATDEASRLFRAARIQISWECPSAQSPEDEGTDMTSAAFRQADTRRYIVVRLMRGTPASVFPGALGYALPFAHTGAHVVIFYDRVESLARVSNEEASMILGHAMAHEIGHVLLGSAEHASGGLMQASWTPATWRLASAGLLTFSREEAERMRAGLQRLQARQPLPVQQPTLAASVVLRPPE